MATNLGDGETNVSRNTKESRNALKKERNEQQPPEIDIPVEFMKEADQNKATPFKVDKDFCDGKREDYISDKDKELLVCNIRRKCATYIDRRGDEPAFPIEMVDLPKASDLSFAC